MLDAHNMQWRSKCCTAMGARNRCLLGGHEHTFRMSGRDGASASVTGHNRRGAANWKSVPAADLAASKS
jgi:hypothetical protein